MDQTRSTLGSALATPPRKARRVDCSTYPTPPSTPDRFITPRRSISAAPETFRVSKSPEELSPTERLLRKRPADFDPFMNRRVTPDLKTQLAMTPQPFGAIRGPQSPAVEPHRRPSRVVSAGSVWRVGGVALPSSPTAAVSDGRGGLLGSGTNAPMFSADFFECETNDQGAVRFEGRIAAALDVDQCRRMLDGSPPLRRPRTSTEGYADPEYPTTWQDGRWVSAKSKRSPPLAQSYQMS